MNMNKIKFLVITFIFSLLIFSAFKMNVYADTCSSASTERICSFRGSCKWVNGACVKTYVAEDPCNEESVRTVLRFFGYLLFIAKILVPLIIIGFGTFDLFKSVIDKDEKSLGKQVKMLLTRVAVGIFIFFIPDIVDVAFSISDTTNVISNNQYKACAKCLLNPKNC